jgi:hypothetical protein
MNRSTEIGCLRVPEIPTNFENPEKVGLVRLPIKVPKSSGGSGQLMVRTSKSLFFNRFGLFTYLALFSFIVNQSFES